MSANPCCCDDICKLRRSNNSSNSWTALLSTAPQLAGIKRRRWIIQPASKLIDSAHGGCQTCLLLYKTIEKLFTWQSITAVHLEASNTIGQIRVTVKQARKAKDAKAARAEAKRKQRSTRSSQRKTPVVLETERSFYLGHPEGYQGFRPFGDGVLQLPRQPRPGHLAYNADAAIHKIQEWVRLCTTNHNGCQHGGYAPTRLLRLKTSNGSESVETVQLFEPLRAFATPFIALSHCWGKTRQAVTTKANYAQRRQGIPVGELSRTLQDAIWITHKLGVKYLWVDTLCIVQDDPDDWDREAINMYRLYGAAYVTLAASHGADGNAGVFPPAAGANHLIPLSIELKTPENVATTVDVEIRSVPRLDKDSQVHKAYGASGDKKDAFLVSEDDDVLQTRGWVLQERALSTRIVHFNAQELVWECRDRRACECGLLSGTSFMTGLMGSLRHRRNPEDLEDPSSEDEEKSLDSNEERQSEFKYETRRFWETFVTMYTNRALTKAQDRGPAFAGIAQTFQKIVNNGNDDYEDGEIGDYYAGLWAQHLPNALLWSCATDDLIAMSLPSVTNTRRESRRIEDAQAPSWSWFSTAGSCAFLRLAGQNQRHYDMRVVYGDNDDDMGFSFFYKSANNSPFGRLTDVSLVIDYAGLSKACRPSSYDRFVLLSAGDEQLGASSSIFIAFDDEAEADVTTEVYLLGLQQASHPCLTPHKEPDWSHLSEEEIMRLELLEDEDPYKIADEYEFDRSQHDSLEDCKEHNFGLALVAVGSRRGTRGNRYRRVGVFHMRGTYCEGMKIHEEYGWWVSYAEEPPKPGGYAKEFTDSLRWEDRVTLL